MVLRLVAFVTALAVFSIVAPVWGFREVAEHQAGPELGPEFSRGRPVGQGTECGAREAPVPALRWAWAGRGLGGSEKRGGWGLRSCSP